MKRTTSLLALVILFSFDLDAQWVHVYSDNVAVTCFAIAGSKLVAGTDANGIRLSTDGGMNWIASGFWDSCWIAAIAANTTAQGDTNFFVAPWRPYYGRGCWYGPCWSALGVHRSSDGGTTWVEMNSGFTETNVIALAARDTLLFAGTKKLFLSTNSGNSWMQVTAGWINSYMNALAFSRSHLFAGTDNGLLRLPLSQKFSPVQPDTGLLPGYPRTSGTVFDCVGPTDPHGKNWYEPEYVDTGWSTISLPDNQWGGLNADRYYRAKVVFPPGADSIKLYFSSDNGIEIYVNGLFLGRWGGACHADSCVNEGNCGSLNTTVSARNISSFLVPGTNTLAFHVSNGNGPASFSYLCSPPFTLCDQTSLGNRMVQCLAVNGTCLLAGTADGVFQSCNNGDTWTAANTGLGDSIARCFSVAGTSIFVGTSQGVSVSTDNGESWLAVNDGLTNPDVTALVADESYLLAATPSGIWRRPLQELLGLGHPALHTLPDAFSLAQNYPNPFNPVTTITYALPARVNVRLSVYNLLGQEVATLVNDHQEPGYKSVTFDASRFPSGMYTYRITAGAFTDMKKMVLIK